MFSSFGDGQARAAAPRALGPLDKGPREEGRKATHEIVLFQNALQFRRVFLALSRSGERNERKKIRMALKGANMSVANVDCKSEMSI